MANALSDVVADELSGEYIARRADEWVRRVGRLVHDLRHWLPDGWRAEETTVTMYEEMMRQHDVSPRSLPRLSLEGPAGDAASLEPYGLWVIGANGHLDLRTPRGAFVIFDRADTDLERPAPRWMIAPLREREHTRELTQESFAATLQG